MTLNQLKEMFPQGYVSSRKVNNEVCIQVENTYFILPKDTLTDREKLLVQSTYHRWYDYLFNNGTPIQDEKHVQIIQFKVEKLEESALWIETLTSVFSGVKDYYLRDNYGFIVCNKENNHLNLEGYLDAIDEDFGTKTSLYIGQYEPLNQDYRDIFLEEQHLFKGSEARISSFINEFVKQAVHEYAYASKTIQKIKYYIKNSKDVENIVIALWNQKGNISGAANELYLHRNTLMYRLEKIHEESGINLRDFDYLVLCYFIL